MTVLMANTNIQGRLMVAGVSGLQSGYRRIVTVIGSLTPDTFNGELIQTLDHVSSTGFPTVQIFQSGGAGTMLQNFWDRIVFASADGNWDGQILLSSAATSYNNSGANAVWTFGVNSPFINGESYNLGWS